MKYCRLGKTDLRVSALGLGTVELGLDYGIGAADSIRRPAETDAMGIIQSALDAGINLIDTARSYGDSEIIIGKALQQRRDQVVVATKATAHAANNQPVPDTALLGHLQTQLDQSLDALATDYIDLWQIHHVDWAVLDQREVLEQAFSVAKRSGKVRWTGGSFYGDQVPLQALETGLFDTMQVAYSAADQRIANRFLPQSGLRNVGVLARSVLLKGVLTERAEFLPARLDALRDCSRQFRKMAGEAGLGEQSVAVAIAFALQNPLVHSVLLGVNSPSELEEGLRAVDLRLPLALREALDGMGLHDAALLDPNLWGI